jgi:hypothetical protein
MQHTNELFGSTVVKGPNFAAIDEVLRFIRKIDWAYSLFGSN